MCDGITVLLLSYRRRCRVPGSGKSICPVLETVPICVGLLFPTASNRILLHYFSTAQWPTKIQDSVIPPRYIGFGMAVICQVGEPTLGSNTRLHRGRSILPPGQFTIVIITVLVDETYDRRGSVAFGRCWYSVVRESFLHALYS